MEKETIQFWKKIIYKDGKIDEEQVMKELSDYYFMLKEVPKVYMGVTNGLLSKPNYPASTVLMEFEDNFYDKTITKDDIEDILKDKNMEDKEKLENIEDYFGIKKDDTTTII